MADFKLTKNELRAQQRRLAQLEKYLPTLQLKKAMLQVEVQKARQEIAQLTVEFEKTQKRVEASSSLLGIRTSIHPEEATRIVKVDKTYENYAGVEVPTFRGVEFQEVIYSLIETPPWVDSMIAELRKVVEAHIRIDVASEKKAALERELREVSIRVNLFEKILIPRARDNIKKIRVFLGDQELAAVCRAKVAKGKIEAAKTMAAVSQESSHAY